MICGLARFHETWYGLLESLVMEYVDVMIDALTETVHVSFGKASTQQCRSGLGGVPALGGGGARWLSGGTLG